MKIRKGKALVQKAGHQGQLPVEGVFQLYRTVFSADYFDQLSRQLGIKIGKVIFNWMVIIFAMMLQRLSSKRTLHATVSDVIPVLRQFSEHKRIREETVSGNPGAFSRARSKMLMTVVEESFDHLFETLHNETGGAAPQGPVAFLLDGSTISLQATPELRKAYPPARNQNGVSHWPIMRVVVAHDLRTGLACRPAWGQKAISEQQLADELMPRLPAGSVIIADRNFGIFASAYQACITGHPVVLRLTEARAAALAGHELKSGTDLSVGWRPSAWDCKNHTALPKEAHIKGRLLVRWVRENGKRVKLYLFSNWEESAEEIFRIYGLRWNIETDLRSLKRTVRLHVLTSRTPDMVAKELVMGVAAYNLVHAFMQAAAQKAGLRPRDLSFSYAQDCVYSQLPALMKATSPEEIQKRMQLLLRHVASCKLPKRTKTRSYDRKIWLRSRSFPTRPTELAVNNVVKTKK